MQNVGMNEVERQDEVPEALPFLPDDILVMVFKHLTVPELFSARIVCRRWADLALHPDVWTDRKLTGTGFQCRPEKGKLRAALALAPRARSLCFDEAANSLFSGWGSNSSIFDDDGALAGLAVKTRCAVESLEIRIDDSHTDIVARILRKQARLRRPSPKKLVLHLDVGLIDPLGPPVSWKSLLASLCAMADLIELDFRVASTEDFDHDWLPTRAPKKASLKRLSCRFADASSWALFMARLIEWHAPTLESVQIRGPDYLTSPVPFPPSCWGDALARAVRLRELDCPMLPNMAESLLQCRELESLCLRFDPNLRRHSAVWRAARDYLRRTAAKLRKLTIGMWVLDMEADYDPALEPAVDLVRALGCQTTLEVLECKLGDFHSGNLELLDRLLAVVPGHLPALRELYLFPSDGEAILRALDSLSRLSRTFMLRVLSDTLCVHEWIFAEAARVKACFDRNPGLHLGLVGFGSGMMCSLECRAVGGKDNIVVYGHPDNVRCDHSQPDTDYTLHSLPGEVEGVEAQAAQ